jgi:hypothetical protein
MVIFSKKNLKIRRSQILKFRNKTTKIVNLNKNQVCMIFFILNNDMKLSIILFIVHSNRIEKL